MKTIDICGLARDFCDADAALNMAVRRMMLGEINGRLSLPDCTCRDTIIDSIVNNLWDAKDATEREKLVHGFYKILERTCDKFFAGCILSKALEGSEWHGINENRAKTILADEHHDEFVRAMMYISGRS